MDKDEEGSERTCIVSRTKGAPEAMIRFVAGPDEMVVPDIRRRLPGRGVWVAASQALVAEAARRQLFSKGLKAKAMAGSELAGQVDDLLATDALQSLSMANKTGAVVAGFFKVEAALTAGAVGVLLHASDAAEDGVRKLAAKFAAGRRRRDAGGPGPAEGEASAEGVIKLFTSEQLDLALGRTNVIHAALAEGAVGQAFLMRCSRLVRYRSAAASVPGGRPAIKGRLERSG